MTRVAKWRALLKSQTVRPLVEAIARFSLLKEISFIIGVLSISYSVSSLSDDDVLTLQVAIALFVYLLAVIGQTTFTILGNRAMTARIHDAIESGRNRIVEEFLDSPPNQLLVVDLEHLVERAVTRPKSLYGYLLAWVPRVVELLFSVILATLILIPLLIFGVSANFLLPFAALVSVNIFWRIGEFLTDSGEIDVNDLKQPTSQGSQDQEVEEVEEVIQATSSLGKIKELRWTDCEIVLGENQAVTFPWGIASSSKLTVVSGLGKNAKKALVETIIGIRTPHQGRLFLETNKGIFRLDELDHSQILNLIGWLPQRPKFISGTIEENLRLIKPRTSREKLNEVLSRVGLSEESLPEGIKTHVTAERMTGIQLKRLALARLLLKDAPLVLAEDEVESQDQEFSTFLSETLKNLARDGKILIVVSDHEDFKKIADRALAIDSDFFKPTFVLESAR